MAQNAFILLTHVWNEAIEFKFNRIRSELSKICDCFILFDRSNNDIVLNLNSKYVHKYTADEIETELGYNCFEKGRISPGSAILPIINFSKNNKYLHYWVMEYDFEFTGDFKLLVNSIINEQVDLAACHFYSYSEQPSWMWWKTIKYNDGSPGEDIRSMFRAFFPIFRISNTSLKLLDSKYTDGFLGHYEGLVPTLLKSNNLICFDFKDVTSFYNCNHSGLISNSTIRASPSIDMSILKDNFKENTFYHPIKKLCAFDSIHNKFIFFQSQKDCVPRESCFL